jgi:hypothetical protein
MKKYEHKITKEIAKQCNHDSDFYSVLPQGEVVPRRFIENSNDWQEIKEYPKIISFRNKYTKNIIDFNSKIDFDQLSNMVSSMFASNKEGYGDYEIYQVAKSETEVYTIGDKVRYKDKCNYVSFIIYDFFYGINENRILARADIKYSALVEDVTMIKKVKEFFFITEDGIDIFEGDSVFYIYKNNIGTIGYIDHFRFDMLLEGNKVWFSTEEATKIYINDNKPQFSKKQIEEALIYSTLTDSDFSNRNFLYKVRFKEKLGI